MLHIIRHSPYSDSRLTSCLRAISPEQSLLLIEEAVYSLLPETASHDALDYLPGSVEIYVLESDLLARGLALDDLKPRVRAIDYAAVVELCLKHSKVMSW